LWPALRRKVERIDAVTKLDDLKVPSGNGLHALDGNLKGQHAVRVNDHIGFPLRLALDAMNRRSNISRALRGSDLPHDEQHVYARNLEVPSGGGVGTARAIARAYSVFATGGRELGLRPETLELLAAPAVPPTRGFYDECMKGGGVHFSLGFMKSTPALPFGSARSFGSPGAGGALGFADPEAGVGYAYVTNRMGTSLTGDPRDVALRNALYAAVRPPSGTLGRLVA
jgi:CubicO group peptidase (beta-lactamase class C family)